MSLTQVNAIIGVSVYYFKSLLACWSVQIRSVGPSLHIFQQPEMLRQLVMGPPTSSWRLETGTSQWHHLLQGVQGWSPRVSVCLLLPAWLGPAHSHHGVLLLTLPGEDAAAGTLLVPSGDLTVCIKTPQCLHGKLLLHYSHLSLWD